MLRHSKYVGRWLAIAVAVGVVCDSTALATKPPKPVTPAYTIVPFVSPFPPTGYSSAGSIVLDLNDCGQAVGCEDYRDANSQTVRQALHLDIATGIYTLLPDDCFAGGVNNLNEIVGVRTLSDGRNIGMFLKSLDALPVDLLPLAASGHTQCEPLAINDAGVVVGYSRNDDGSSASGVVWIVKVEGDAVSVHGPWALPPLAGDARGCAEDLNEVMDGSCQATGESFGATDESYEAVVWTVTVAGTTATSGPAVSLVENHARSVGSGINCFGDACGLVAAGSKSMPFLTPAGQAANLLPVPRNTQYGHALDINNFGEVVGYLVIVIKGGWGEGHYAYLWKDGGMFDLNNLIGRDSGWAHLWGARLINDAGIIAGWGYYQIEQHRGFFLIPNP
jgi:probable HAF family extracellular repeat protein